jgi:hypothetical protein
MTPYKFLDDPTLGEISSKHSAAADDEGRRGSDIDEEYTDLLRAVFMGPAAPEPATPLPSDEEMWSEIIGGGNDDDAAAAREVEALRLLDIIDGRADEEGDKGRCDSDDEFVSFLDCLDKEGGGGCVGPVDHEKEDFDGGKDADFAVFLSYFNSQQQQQQEQQTMKIDNFGFLPAQRADSVEAVWSKIVSGMSEEQKVELMDKADPAAEGQAEPPSWWQWLGFGAASVQVQPEARQEDDAIEQEESFV